MPIDHVYECLTDPVVMLIGEDLDPAHGAPSPRHMSGRTACPVCGKGLSYRGPQGESNNQAQAEAPPEEKPKAKRGRKKKTQEAAGQREEQAQAEQEDVPVDGGPYPAWHDSPRDEDPL